MAQQKLSDPNQALSGRLYHTHENINELSCCLVVLLSGCLVVDSFGWKPIPSEARVTWDEVSGIKKVRESCLPDSLSLLLYNPETLSQVTLAALGTVFQTDNKTTKQLNNQTTKQPNN